MPRFDPRLLALGSVSLIALFPLVHFLADWLPLYCVMRALDASVTLCQIMLRAFVKCFLDHRADGDGVALLRPDICGVVASWCSFRGLRYLSGPSSQCW